MPVVSVVMAVRNGEKYLLKAVDSVLAQTLTDLELIVVNDGSTDGTDAVLASYDDQRLRVLRRSGHGLAASLNTGIREARAPLIARMDADDISEPSRLERQARFLAANEDYVLVGSDAFVISEEGELLYRARLVTSDAAIRHCLDQLVTPFYHGAVMFRREKSVECGLYDERIPQLIEDITLWLRLRRLGSMANLSEPLYRYRLRADSLSRQGRGLEETRARILRDYDSAASLNLADIGALTVPFRMSRRAQRAAYELDLGKVYLDQVGDLPRARSHLGRSVALAPTSSRAWFNFCLSLFPDAVRSRRIRQRNRRIHLRAEGRL
jgi:glycosyltransferase involved in cell wall biosynthesis